MGTRDAQTANLVDEHATFLQDGAHDGILTLYEGMIGDIHVPDALQHVTEVVRTALDAERATTYLVERSTQELESVATIGNVARIVRVPIRHTSLSGYCALTQRAFLVDDAYGDLSHIDPTLRFDRSWDEASGFRTRDVMCAPAVFRDETLGVVQVINKQGAETFSEEDLTTLQRIARLVAYSLYHARMYDELATLKYLKKEEAKFMRIMVHELKSPVATAKMAVDAEAFINPGNEAVCSLSTKVGEKLDTLLDMIGDVLQFSRVRDGAPLGKVAVIDLRTPVHEQCMVYEEQAQHKGIGWETRLPAEECRVRFDETGVKLVVSNLVGNAVKYTNEGTVSVFVKKHDDRVTLEVKDSGIGIPADDIPNLFTDFYRASNARRSEIKGSGVGLAGAKEMIERFGGTISLESVENEGSTFTVSLPAAE